MIVERLGPYKIVDRIGAGGMGEVFKGVHDETGQVVAIKLISSTDADDSQLIKRFRREIVSASRLSHDNIVRVYDSGDQDEHVWYSMEYIDGSSLSDLLKDNEPLEQSRALSIAKDLCKAFVYMHSRGFIHRDIKPGNIMVSRDGVAKLVDFGLVKSKFATNITVTGVVIGTPAFMSPEMLQGRDVDHRSDIFQLGQVLYKMLTGRGAFEGANSFEIATACVTGAPKPLTALRPAISPSLEAVVLHCLEKNSEDRYNSAADILNDLKRAEKGLKPMGASLRKPAAAPPSSTVPTMPIELPPKQGLSPSLVGLGIVLGAGLLIGGLYVAMEARSDSAYDFRNFRIEAGLKRARVRWESETPYPSRLLYASTAASDGGGSLGFDTGTEVVNGTEGEAVHHSLDLRSLSPDTSYHAAVVYPSRRLSLPQTFRTQKSGIRSHAFTFGAGGAPVLTFATHVPAKTAIRWEPAHEARSATFSTSHSTVLTGADPFGEGSVKVVCTNSLDEQWALSPIPLPDVRLLARELTRAVDAAQARVLGLMSSLDRADHQRKLDPAMVRDALPRPLMESISRFTPIGPGYFASRRVTLEEKAALYRPLAAILALDVYAATRKLPFHSGTARLLGPDFGPLPEPGLPDTERKKHSDSTKLISPTLPASQVDMMATFAKVSRGMKIVFPVENVSTVSRAELTVHGFWEGGFTFDEMLVARINGGLELSLYRNPALPPNEKHLHFVHGFDPRALTEGANEFRLTLRPLPGLKSSTELQILAVSLRVAR